MHKETTIIDMSYTTHVGHVRLKPDCSFWDWSLWFVIFFRVSIKKCKWLCVMYVWLDERIVPQCSTRCANLDRSRPESLPDKVRHQRTRYRRVAKLNYLHNCVHFSNVSIRSIVTLLFMWLVILCGEDTNTYFPITRYQSRHVCRTACVWYAQCMYA